jgi:hypothetical protein
MSIKDAVAGGTKKVLDYLLPRLIIVLSLPAAYLGAFWLIGLVMGMRAQAASNSSVPLDKQFENHPIMGALAVFAFFDSPIVRDIGLVALIAASVLWLAYLVVGTSLPRKLVTLAFLLLSVGGIYFAKAIWHR